MKLALISDIHGNLPALRAVLTDAQARGATRFAFLGDYTTGLGWPNEVLAVLRGLEREGAVVVSGNEDEGLAALAHRDPATCTDGQFSVAYWLHGYLSPENRTFLAGLPEERVLSLPDVPEGAPPVRLFHKPQRYFDGATPCELRPQTYAAGIDAGAFTGATYAAHAAALLENDALLQAQLAALPAGVYAFGHTHIQWQWRCGGHLLLNPGSCGVPLDFDRSAPYALLEWAGGEWRAELRRVAYDVDGAVAATRASECAKNAPVWCGVLSRELETAREQAIPFLHHAEAFANACGDAVRPFTHATWNAAYAAWVQQGRSKG